MRDTIEAIVTLVWNYPVRTLLVCLATAGLTWKAADFVFCAGTSHAQTAENEKTIKQVAEGLRAIADAKEAEAKEEAAAKAKLRELCMSGALKMTPQNRDKCAAVQTELAE